MAGRQQVEELRALVATAARHGVLAVDREDAERFGRRVRQLKRFDPTLGIYAALAYADVGRKKQARSVLEYMRNDLDADLFDVWLLAGAPAAAQVVPSCPMLSQCWSFLRSRGVWVPEVLSRAPRRNALWTTFEPDHFAQIRDAAIEGALA
jgi:hypothetical protein